MPVAGIYGPTEERLALARRASELRAEGLLLREIQVELRISRSYVSELLRDPDGSLARARKDGYAGVCENCGAATSGSNGHKRAPRFCHDCIGEQTRIWSREKIIDAILAYHSKYGEVPSVTAFSPANARQVMERVSPDKQGRYWEQIRRFADDDCYPVANTVTTYFDSFEDALLAAGLPLHLRSVNGGPSTDDVLDRLRALADELGHTPSRNEWDASGPPLGASGLMYRICGHEHPRWSEVCRTADLEPNEAFAEAYWTRERIIDAIQAWTRSVGRPPVSTEWSRPGSGIAAGWPHYSQVRDRFGTWGAALAAASSNGASR